MVITDAGKVGIGTDAPGRKLHLKDGQIKFQNTGSGGWAGLDFSMGNGTYDGYMGMLDSDGKFFIDVDSNGNDFVILQNGNVGIGTNSPLTKLQVADNEVFIHGGTTTTGPGIFLGDNNFNNSNYYNSAPGIGAVGPYGGVSGGLGFYTYGGATNSRNEHMRIDNLGKVGIAEGGVIYASRFSVGKPHTHTPGSAFTNSPSSFYSEVQLGGTTGNDQKLATFAGTDGSNVSGLALYRYRRATGTNWTTDGFSLRQEVDNTENIYDYINFAAGKVGIGVTAPTSKLTLPLEEEGNFKLKFQASSGTGHAGISTVDQSGAGLYIGANSYANASGVPVYGRSDHPSSGIYFDGWNTDRMRFYTGASGNPTEKMTILSDGKVGIGNQDPQVTLALGNASGERLHVYHGGSIRAGFGVDLSGSSRELSMFHSTTGTNGNISFGKRLESNGTYTESMRVAADGNVYFGPNGSTADPRITRHSNGYDYINSGNSRWLKVGASSGHTNVAFQDGSSGVTIFETAGQERMRIHANGHVSIGTVTDLAFVRPVYRKNITLNKTYTALFNTNGAQLSSGFVLSIHGTGSSVVVNAKFDVLVNHYQDITISALGTYYTLCKIKVVTNGNEDCTVYAAINSANSSSCTIEVEPLHNTSLEFSPSSVFSTNYYIHEASGGHTVGTTGGMPAGAGTTTGYS